MSEDAASPGVLNPVAFNASLHAQIANALFLNDNAAVPFSEFDLQITGDIQTAIIEAYGTQSPTAPTYTITLEFPFQSVENRAGIPEIDDPFDPGNKIDRVPATATVNARMIVTVVVDIGSFSARSTSRVLTSEATYELRSCIFSDAVTEGNMLLDLENPGEWVLISYEISE